MYIIRIIYDFFDMKGNSAFTFALVDGLFTYDRLIDLIFFLFLRCLF